MRAHVESVVIERPVHAVRVAQAAPLGETVSRASNSARISVRSMISFALAALLLACIPAAAAAQGDATAAAPLPPGSGADLAFELANVPTIADLGDAFIVAIAEGDGSYVALAQPYGSGVLVSPSTTLLRSSDGLDWEIVEPQLPGDLYGLVGSEHGFLLGIDDSRRARQILYRSEDGLTWEEMPLRGADYLEGIAAAPDGFLGLGCDRYCERTVLYRSEDGRRWERDRAFTSRIRLTDAAVSGNTLVAIADPIFGGDNAAVAQIDGRWVDLVLPLPAVPTDGYVSIRDVAALPGGGFAIVGSTETAKGATEPFLVTSPDGVSWVLESVELDLGMERAWADPYGIAAGPGLVMLDVLLSGRGARASGLEDVEAIAWSTDADGWRLVTLPQQQGFYDQLVTRDGRAIVVGASNGGRSTRPAIWVGSLAAGGDPGADPDPSASGDPAGTPAADATRTSRGERARQEQALLDQAGYASCAPFRARGDFDPFEFGATAAVQCDRPMAGIGQVAVFQFPDAVSMDEYWSYRLEAMSPALPFSERACQADGVGVTPWDHGPVACYRSSIDNEARVRWTDSRTNTYWLADANHRDLARLARWWREERP